MFELRVHAPLKDRKREVFSVKPDGIEMEAVGDLKIESLSRNAVVVESELVNPLNKDVCSARLETEPMDVVRLTVRPLKNEEARLNEPDSVLNMEFFAARLEAVPMEPVKATFRPLVGELERVSDPVRVLNSDVCSVKLEAEPSALASFRLTPFN